MGLLLQGGRIPNSALDFPVTAGFSPSLALSAFIIMFLSHVVGPDIYSKVFSSRSIEDSRKGVIGGALFKLLSSLLVASIALVGISIYGASVSGGSLIPTAARDTLPPLVFSIAMVGMVSVMLSSADSCLISGATFLSWDLMGGKGVKFARILGIAGLGALAYFVAFYSSGILDTLTLSYTLFSAGIVPAVFLIPWKEKMRLTSNGAIGSLVVGGGGVVLLYVLSKFGYWTGSLLYIPLTLSFLSLPLLSWFLPKGSMDPKLVQDRSKRRMNRAPDGTTGTRSNGQ
jgi:SSS family solute:Na+ symporter